MLRIYISAIILLAIEYASLANTSTNITAWLAPSRGPPLIILQANQMIPSTVDCQQNGKTYKEGKTWYTGHLLYKCMALILYLVVVQEKVGQ
uniref:Secreted protein n=1 Tax=Wuchereria bancrofti TaxID=6293 RepID=A0A1I8EBT5_WUCBA